MQTELNYDIATLSRAADRLTSHPNFGRNMSSAQHVFGATYLRGWDRFPVRLDASLAEKVKTVCIFMRHLRDQWEKF